MTTLKDDARQRAEAESVQVPEVDLLDKPLVTAFGGFQIRKRFPPNRPAEYLLRGTNAAGRQVLTGSGDVFAPDVVLTAVDDADALHQTLTHLWHRFDAGLEEFAGVVRANGLELAPADSEA